MCFTAKLALEVRRRSNAPGDAMLAINDDKAVSEDQAVMLEPLTVRIPVAVKLTGISRSRLYELIQTGDLETIKVGRSTLIPYKSLKALTRS